MKKIYIFCLTAAMAFLALSCTDKAAEPEMPAVSVAVEALTLSDQFVELEEGGQYRLEAGVSPSDASFTVEWSSSDPDVATVDDYGCVSAVSAGHCEITAKAGDCSSVCRFSVIRPGCVRLGDYYYSDGTWSTDLDYSKIVLGIVFYVGEDGFSGKIMSFEEGDRLWGVAGTFVGATDDLDGKSNYDLYLSAIDWSNKYYAVKWCYQKASVGLQWYLPAKQELRQMFAGISGVRWKVSGAEEEYGEIDDWPDGKSALLDEVYSEARDRFNRRLAAVTGATALTLDGHAYWSSTEQENPEAVWAVSMDKGITMYVGKDAGYARIRAVARFGEDGL